MNPMSDIAALFLATASNATISDDESKRLDMERDRDARRERLRRYAHVVSAEDIDRIVSRKLDSAAWAVVCQSMRRWRAGKLRFLWLCGLTGRGKTVACMGALAELGGTYVTADEVRRAFAQETDEARELRFRMRGSCLVLIDDTGTERDAAKAKQALQELVNLRQGRGLITLITSNLSKADVRKRYDERTVARIEHQGVIVEVEGNDMRRKS
jgi:DNA replication protein DnaC